MTTKEMLIKNAEMLRTEWAMRKALRYIQLLLEAEEENKGRYD